MLFALIHLTDYRCHFGDFYWQSSGLVASSESCEDLDAIKLHFIDLTGSNGVKTFISKIRGTFS